VVDFSVLSDGAIHNKFDQASVNDPDVGIQSAQQLLLDAAEAA
jgi:hypothetical protein